MKEKILPNVGTCASKKDSKHPNPKPKQSPSSGSNLLTPSELDSLKKDTKDFYKYAKGKFKDLT